MFNIKDFFYVNCRYTEYPLNLFSWVLGFKRYLEIDVRKKEHELQFLFIIIIIIIRKGRQCKAGRERLTHYQSEDPNPTTPTHRMKKEKGKTVGEKK